MWKFFKIIFVLKVMCEVSIILSLEPNNMNRYCYNNEARHQSMFETKIKFSLPWLFFLAFWRLNFLETLVWEKKNKAYGIFLDHARIILFQWHVLLIGMCVYIHV